LAPPNGGLPKTYEHSSGGRRSVQSISSASAFRMCGDFSMGIRAYVWPNSGLSRLFMMWSIIHSAVAAIRTGNSPISMP